MRKLRWVRALVGIFAIAVMFDVAADPGVTNKTILLGQSAPMSGPLMELGQQYSLGAKSYFDEINDQGGVFGRKIELRTLDDFDDPGQTTRNTAALFNDIKAFALFGYIGTPATQIGAKAAHDNGTVMFAPLSGDTTIRQLFSHNAIYIRRSAEDEIAALIRQILATGVHDISVVYESDTQHQTNLAIADRIWKAKAGSSFVSVGLKPNASVTAADLAPVLKQNSQYILLFLPYDKAIQTIQIAHKSGFRGSFATTSEANLEAIQASLGKEAAGLVVSQLYPDPDSSTYPIVREYQRILSGKGITNYNYGSFEGFLAAVIWVDMLKKAGKDLTREKVMTTFESMPDIDIGGLTINLSAERKSDLGYLEVIILNNQGQIIK